MSETILAIDGLNVRLPEGADRTHALSDVSLSVAANDRTGLLYSIATVLTKYKINLHTAKIMTLGERVEDVFIIDGAPLANARVQLQLETELLEALKV